MSHTNPFLQIACYIVLLTAVGTHGADDCVDKITNCRSYGTDACTTYKDWAQLNCAYTCSFCTGPPPSTQCVDNRNDCDNYVADICTVSSWKVWAEDNCSKFCGFCSPSTDAATTPMVQTQPTSTTLTTVQTQTQTTQKATTPCTDGINFCTVYSKRACTDGAWAEKYCKKYCSKC